MTTRHEEAISIGNQTAFSAATPVEPFEYAVENGFKAFEWFPDKDSNSGAGWEEGDFNSETRRYIRDRALKQGIHLSVHAPWWVNPLESGSDKRFFESLLFACDINASIINLHLYTDYGIDAYIKAITSYIKHLKALPIRLSIENTPLTTPEDLNELYAGLLEIENLNISDVGICLDLGHANLCAATRNNFLDFIDRLERHVPIIHIHLHENYGDEDSHLTLFTGPSAQNAAGIQGFVDRIKTRNYSGAIIMEQWPNPTSLLNQAYDRLYQMIKTGSMTADKKPDKIKGEKPRPTEPDDFCEIIARIDQGAMSWREKLTAIEALLFDPPHDPDQEQLVYLAIYLHFLGAGQVACVEDGRHFRPSHHADISRRIHERLVGMSTPENAFILRKIYPWLPSYDQPFVRAEPFTRIRDIAHRNDCPQELKLEIKHKLQNKLHRCAGPEDFVTSARLLERIISPDSGCSPDFVEQFKIFHKELKEFFNASSLLEQLDRIMENSEKSEAALIHKFLKIQKKVDTPNRQIEALELLTSLRKRLLPRWQKYTDAPAQRLRLADIGLEELAYILLSRFIQHVDDDKEPFAWDLALKGLALTLSNLKLNSMLSQDPKLTLEPFADSVFISIQESSNLEAEIKAWSRNFDPFDRQQLLRLKAALDRSERMTAEFSERVLNLYCEQAEKLGRALGVAEHAIRTFSEGELRGHLIFQLSKLVNALIKRIRILASLSPWDIVVAGTAVGRLMAVENLDDPIDIQKEPVILLSKRAGGDEEIPANVVGIILAHEMPHLSHLAIRARQKKVVFASCEEEGRLAKILGHVGDSVNLTASADNVFVSAETSLDQHDEGTPLKLVPGPEALLCTDCKWLPLDQIALENSGGKAWGAKTLGDLSRMEKAGFKTPLSVVVPFGVMEYCLHKRPDLARAFAMAVRVLDETDENDFSEICDELHALAREISLPDNYFSGIKDIFVSDERLMVRSSANCEDLKDFAGAGLYDSLANVKLSDLAEAVSHVWASLWTKGAVISRKDTGLPNDKAYMAVLIQQMLSPDISFIIHTVNPITGNSEEAYLELALGLGEILTSGAIRGTPYRMICNKNTGQVSMSAYANFSYGLWPGVEKGLIRKAIDYSKVELSCKAETRSAIGGRLADISQLIEKFYKGPQDIEGVIVGQDIYLLQVRPQQGII